MNLLIESALKATVILAAAWVATLALRRASANARHTIWLVAMLAVAILPAVLAIPRGAMPSAALIVVPVSAATVQSAARKLPWLLTIWITGVSVVMLRMVAGMVAASRITRSARLLDCVLYTDRAATPMTWGFLRPVIILPAYATQWTSEERDLVIRHEQAHIARRDWLSQTFAGLMTAVFWFHPLMWLANLQLRREAETAADDLVLSRGAVASEYAGRLLEVAKRLSGVPTPAVVIPMVRKPELESRVRAILDPSRRRVGPGVFLRCAIAAAVLILPLAFTRQQVHAQGQVYKVGKDVTQPSIIRKVDPTYTEEAQADRIEGTVEIEGVVTPEGVASDIRVIRSLGHGLDQKAIEAVEQWRFKPGMKDGAPVRVAVRIEVNFHLK